MIRIVLDTNIVVAALLNPEGAPARVFLLTLLEPDIQLCVSPDIFVEYEDVLRRPLFRRTATEIDAVLRTIREQAFWVRPAESVRNCVDPEDDMFLECAQAANAHYLVTGNTKHFPSSWANTRIITARQVLDELG